MHFSGLRSLLQFWICLFVHPHSLLLTSCGCTFLDSILSSNPEFACLCIRILFFPPVADALFRTQVSLLFLDLLVCASAFSSSCRVRMHFSRFKSFFSSLIGLIYIPYNRFAFSQVTVSTSSDIIPFISAIASITSGRYREQFRLPRCGVGARYGQSVSTTSCSTGA